MYVRPPCSVQLQLLQRAIKKCREQGLLLHQCPVVLDDVLASGDRYLANLLVDVYGKCGSVIRARAVFDAIPRRNVFSWNAMLAAYARNGHTTTARVAFALFPLRDVVSWNTMLEILLEESNNVGARDLFLVMPQRDAVSWSTMSGAFSRLDDAAAAFFLRVPCHGLRISTAWIALLASSGWMELAKRAFDAMPQRDGVAWTCMIRALALDGDLHRAALAFARIPLRSACCWNVAIQMFAQSGRIEDAVALLCEMPEPTLVSWTIAIAALARHGQPERSRSVFAAMPAKNVVAWTALLECCVVAEEAAAIFDRMPQHDRIAMSSLLAAYARVGHLDRALEIFDSMPDRCLPSMNALVGAYAQAGRLREAGHLLERGVLEGLAPNASSFVGILAGISYTGNIQSGQQCFLSMVADYGVAPCVDHYCCMIHLLGRADRPGEAQDLIDNMPFFATEIEWTSLLDSSRIHGNVDWEVMAAENAWKTRVH